MYWIAHNCMQELTARISGDETQAGSMYICTNLNVYMKYNIETATVKIVNNGSG